MNIFFNPFAEELENERTRGKKNKDTNILR